MYRLMKRVMRVKVVAVTFTLWVAMIALQVPCLAAPSADQTAITNATIALYHSDPRLTISEAIISASGTYGLTTFQAGESGGQAIWTKTSGTWKLLRRVGGIFSACDMANRGVPTADAISLASQSSDSSSANRITHCALTPPQHHALIAGSVIAPRHACRP